MNLTFGYGNDDQHIDFNKCWVALLWMNTFSGKDE